MQLKGPRKSPLSVCLSVHPSVNSFSENWLSSFFIHLMTRFRFSQKILIGPILDKYGQRWPKYNVLLYFLTLYVLLFAICTIFKPVRTITLYVLFLTLFVVFFFIFNSSLLYQKSGILMLTILTLVKIYTRITGLEKHTNQSGGLLILLTSALFL